MAWTKAKTAVAVSIGVLLTAGTAALLIKQLTRSPDLAILQGTWIGQEMRAGAGESTVVIQGAHLDFRSADGFEWYKATFSLRVNTNPKQLVVAITDCSAPEYVGKTTYAIYQMNRDTFTIAAGEPGVTTMPASFNSDNIRKFVFKKSSSGGAPPPANAAGFTQASLTPKNGESIPGWGEVIDPDGDCLLALTDGKLMVNLPGSDHALMPERGRANAPRVLQEVSRPFDMQVKLTSHFTGGAKTIVAGRNPYQDAGLLVWIDEKNNLKLAPAQIGRDGKNFRFFHLEFRHEGKYGELMLPKESNNLLRESTYYLRLQINKDRTTASVSGDGVKWFSTSLPGADAPEKMRVGIIAENNTTSPLTIGFEEFALKQE